MNIRDMASQVQMRQAQTQHWNAAAQQLQTEAANKQQDLKDQNTYMQAMKDPGINAKVHTGDFSDLESQMAPRNLDIVRNSYLTYMKNLNANTTEQNTIRNTGYDEINKTVSSLLLGPNGDGKPTVDWVNDNLPGAIQNLASAGSFKRAGIDTSKIPTKVDSLDPLISLRAQLAGTMAAHVQDLTNRETAAKAAASEATARDTGTKADIAAEQLKNMTRGLLPAEVVQQQEAAARLAQANAQMQQQGRHYLATEATSKISAMASAQRAGTAAAVAKQIYGGGAGGVQGEGGEPFKVGQFVQGYGYYKGHDGQGHSAFSKTPLAPIDMGGEQ
jgi:hypothetical protein